MSEKILVFDEQAVIFLRGPKLHWVGPSCVQEIWDDGRKGKYRFV